jgi:Flp pilus assembly protein TadG
MTGRKRLFKSRLWRRSRGEGAPDPHVQMGEHRPRRRGVVVVQVVVFGTILIGMAALVVDMGYLWNVRADLQRTADASALAAAAMLAESDEPADQARQKATEYVQRNNVFNEGATLAVGDVALGRAELVGGSYQFVEVPDTQFPDAVRVRVEATRGMFFGHFFGRGSRTLAAEATALLMPRDIVLVADLSASHNDDSELGSYRDTQINTWEVWDALPGGSDDVNSTWTPQGLAGLTLDENGFNPQSAGPAWGYFQNLKWGGQNIDGTYEPTTDAGLIRLSRYGDGTNDWNDPGLRTYLENIEFENGARYSPDEVNEILNVGNHGSWSRYKRQVAVAMGLARWDSGLPGGAWESIPGAGGDNDGRVDSGEIAWVETHFNQPGSRWLDYIGWAGSSWSRMASANSDFRYSFGPKTFSNWLLEQRWSNAATPELAATPHQPMQAVKDAVELMVDVVNGYDNDDQLALDVYGYTTSHRVPLRARPNLAEISTGANGLSNMQAGYFDGWTNMGKGLSDGIDTLTNGPGTQGYARPNAHKMLVLLTDGRANITPDGQWPSGSYADQQAILAEARQYVLDQATRANSLGIRIFAVSVGSYADIGLMDEVAAIGQGEHLQATSNDIATYQAQLRDIFVRLGGKRPVELIN